MLLPLKFQVRGQCTLPNAMMQWGVAAGESWEVLEGFELGRTQAHTTSIKPCPVSQPDRLPLCHAACHSRHRLTQPQIAD